MKRRLIAIIAGLALALSAGVGGARAAEVRIGFIAPMTGIFAQIGICKATSTGVIDRFKTSSYLPPCSR